MSSNWNTVQFDFKEPLVAARPLKRLIDDKAAVIVLKGVLEPAEYERIAAMVKERRDRTTVNVYANASLTTMGTYLAKHLRKPEEYFSQDDSVNDLFAEAGFDLRDRVRQRLAVALGLRSMQVAREADGRSYAPAIIRLHGDGVSNPLHNDNIMRDAAGSGLAVTRLRRQFSCVTCLQECDKGGELLHYSRRWEASDERFKVPQGLGYHHEVVHGAEVVRFRPKTGDVYVIDPTHYHAIEAVQGKDRITMGFFFGFFDDDFRDAICWS